MQQAIIRLLVATIVLLNQVLVAYGLNPIPYSEEEIYSGLSALASAITVLWIWWKNNNVTKEAQQAQKHLDELKAKGDK